MQQVARRKALARSLCFARSLHVALERLFSLFVCESTAAYHKVRKALRVASIVALVAAAATFARQMPTGAVVGFAVLAVALAGVREFLGGLVGKMRVGPYPPPRRPPSMMEAALESARIALI